MELSQGSRLANRFKVVGSLGQGTFGATFLAADAARSDAVVVLKTLPATLSSEARARLKQRVALGREIQHPSLARVLDLVDDPEFLAISYQYIRGKDLEELLNAKMYEPTELVTALSDTTDALKILHAQQFAGALIKPSNIIRSEDGAYVLTDWVLPATAMNAQKSGAQHYRAPELVDGVGASEKSDIYALGVLANELRNAVSLWGEPHINTAVVTFIKNCTSSESLRYQNLETVQRELRWLRERLSIRLLCSGNTFLAFMLLFVAAVVGSVVFFG